MKLAAAQWHDMENLLYRILPKSLNERANCGHRRLCVTVAAVILDETLFSSANSCKEILTLSGTKPDKDFSRSYYVTISQNDGRTDVVAKCGVSFFVLRNVRLKYEEAPTLAVRTYVR